MRSEKEIRGSIELQGAYLAAEKALLLAESDPIEAARTIHKVEMWRNRIQVLEWVLQEPTCPNGPVVT